MKILQTGTFFSLLPVLTAAALLFSIPVISYNAEAELLWIPQMLTAVLTGTLFIRYALQQELPRVPLSILLYCAWVVLAGISLLSVPISPESQELYLTLVKVALMTVAFSIVASTISDLRTLLFLLVLSLPLVLWLNGEQIESYGSALQSGGMRRFEMEESRLAGTLGNANTMAEYAFFVLWATIALLLSSKRKARWLYLLPVVPSLYLIYLAGSRKGLIILPLSVLALYVFYFRARIRSKTLRLAVVLPILAAGVYLMIDWMLTSEWGYRLSGIFTGKYDSSASKRAEMAWQGFQMFLEHPVFGVGFDQYRFASWRWGAMIGFYSHSTFIEILSCLGSVGIMLYIAVFVRLFQEFNRARKKVLGNEELGLIAAALWLALAFAFFSLFAVEFYAKIFWPLLGALAGYAGAIRHRPAETGGAPVPPGDGENVARPASATRWPGAPSSRWEGVQS